MTETLHAPARPFGPDSPIAHLLDLAEQAGDSPTEEEQRDDAETAALHHIYNTYSYSLAQVVDAAAWKGYPALHEDGRRREASAVAWLDGGLWLHHTLRITEADGAIDTLTLIVPCTCGRGYVDIGFETEEDLMEMVSELRPTAGRSPHDERDPLDCASVRITPHIGAVDWQ
jgi:hypothetical protein